MIKLIVSAMLAGSLAFISSPAFAQGGCGDNNCSVGNLDDFGTGNYGGHVEGTRILDGEEQAGSRSGGGSELGGFGFRSTFDSPSGSDSMSGGGGDYESWNGRIVIDGETVFTGRLGGAGAPN